MAQTKYPRTREALLKQFDAERVEERARVPGMCAFVLANYMGCRRMAVQSGTLCTRHVAIQQMIDAGQLSPNDLSYELIAQPL